MKTYNLICDGRAMAQIIPLNVPKNIDPKVLELMMNNILIKCTIKYCEVIEEEEYFKRIMSRINEID